MEIHCINRSTPFDDLNLHYCGYHECHSDFVYGPHTRDCFLIHYVIKGEGALEAGGKEYTVKEGEVFAIFPDEVVSYRANRDNPWVYCWFAFGGNMAHEILYRSGVVPLNPVRGIVPGNNIPELVNNLIGIMQSENPNQLRMLGILYNMLAWLDDPGDRIAQADRKKVDHVKKAVRYIEYNYFKQFTIQELSDFVCLERTYFSKLFRESTGVSPQDFLARYRIEKSVSLMKSTSLSLKQICKCVGIEEAYYYSRVFKKIMGISPQKYREVLEG